MTKRPSSLESPHLKTLSGLTVYTFLMLRSCTSCRISPEKTEEKPRPGKKQM